MTPDFSYSVNNSDPNDRKRFIRGMFDSIVPTYDLLNRLLSAGIDRSWRKFVIKEAGDLKDGRALDLCCGTGDLSLQLYRAGASLVSLDFSLPMLAAGKSRGWLRGDSVAADASRLPFRDGVFRVLTVAFGIRNIPDIDLFMAEAFRATRPGGRLIILELTRPSNPLVRASYNFYLRFVLPVAGGLVSGKWAAYRYLSRTIETFLDPDDLAARLKRAGFGKVVINRLTFGIATVICCEK
ncbi:MAG TPA: ubiquinone/menaquinone biosynthesis methyltransferase [Spirochaetota bacterium]|nr:ubiquinone/menaquinone biosynthesis methyltransferase [Spirochaetota bacterium]